MIDFVISFITLQLREYLDQFTSGIDVEGGNVAEMNGGIGEKVLVTLMNIEEEHTLSNQKYTRKINNQLVKKEPPIVLNLYLLVSFGFDNYNNKLFQQTRTLEFFQKNKTFTTKNYPELESRDIDKLVFKLFTLDMEQLNDMWSMMGGKFYPSLLYKVRLLEVDAKIIDGLGIPIEEIEIESGIINSVS